MRRHVSRIPVRWRGAVMLTAFALLFPLCIAGAVGESLIAGDAVGAPHLESVSAHEPD